MGADLPNVLTLVDASATFSWPDARRVRFLDFHVDQQSLLEWLGWLEEDSEVIRQAREGRVTRFGCFDERTAHDACARLLLRAPSDFPDGHVPLYVCPCGSLECGCITVKVERRGDRVQWRDFGTNGVACFPNMPDLTFEWSAYRSTLLDGRW